MLHNYFSLVFINSNISTLKCIREEHSLLLFFFKSVVIIEPDYNPALCRYFSEMIKTNFQDSLMNRKFERTMFI